MKIIKNLSKVCHLGYVCNMYLFGTCNVIFLVWVASKGLNFAMFLDIILLPSVMHFEFLELEEEGKWVNIVYVFFQMKDIIYSKKKETKHCYFMHPHACWMVLMVCIQLTQIWWNGVSQTPLNPNQLNKNLKYTMSTKLGLEFVVRKATPLWYRPTNFRWSPSLKWQVPNNFKVH
jgi:hypothetical protein